MVNKLAEQTGTKEELPSREGMVKDFNGDWLFILGGPLKPSDGNAPPIPSRKVMKFNRLMQLKQPNMNRVLEELMTLFRSWPDTPDPRRHKPETLHFKIFFFGARDGSSG